MSKDMMLTILSLTGIVGLAVKCVWDSISKKISRKKEGDEALTKGIQALLRDRLICLYDEYRLIGSAPIHVKDSFENMYQWYHALGANGVMDAIHEEFQNIPISRGDNNEEND